MNTDLIFLMHIPKTAGMTLQTLVRERYSLSDELFLVYDKETNLSGFEDSDKLKLVMGHFRFGYHKYSHRNPKYYTFLRNPLDQIVSHYAYYLDFPEKFPRIEKPISSLMDFVKSPYGANLQTKFISGITEIEGREEEVLALAKENLRSFSFVGLTEDFDTSLYLMSKKLGWKIPFYKVKNQGVTKSRFPPLSALEIDEIKKLNQLDEIVYKYGKELYEGKKKNLPLLSFKTTLFQLQNRLFWKLNPIYIRFKVFFNLTDKNLYKKI